MKNNEKYLNLKTLIYTISKLITSFTISIVLTDKITEALKLHGGNKLFKFIIPIATFVTVSTIMDCLLYIVEKAYENNQISLCQAAELITAIRNLNKEEESGDEDGDAVENNIND